MMPRRRYSDCPLTSVERQVQIEKLMRSILKYRRTLKQSNSLLNQKIDLLSKDLHKTDLRVSKRRNQEKEPNNKDADKKHKLKAKKAEDGSKSREIGEQ